MKGATAYGHKHGEAFMLMQYASRDGMHSEIIWNSRDGVTPFVITSKDGTTEMTHVNWNNDHYAPGFVPPLGSRMFVDLTEDRRRALAVKTAERYWETYPPSREQFSTVEDLAEMLASHAVEPGEPDLVVVAG